jgi:zinc transport system substrate-binding protein
MIMIATERTALSVCRLNRQKTSSKSLNWRELVYWRQSVQYLPPKSIKNIPNLPRISFHLFRLKFASTPENFFTRYKKLKAFFEAQPYGSQKHFKEFDLKRTILILITAAAILFGISGCKQKKTAQRGGAERGSDGRITVTATMFPAYDFARQIAGDKVNLSMLLPPGSESHSFEPSPRDIIAIQNSDIFLYAGGNSDRWVERILESMDTDSMKILAMADTVTMVEEEIVEGMEDDEEEGSDDDEEGEVEYDEHVWTSPKNAILIVRAITELRCEADAANAESYRQNAAAYSLALSELDAAFESATADAKRKIIVFGDRFPFRYLADAYGLSYFAAFPGCSTETEPSAATVAFLINKIKAENMPVVFHIELSNERMADTISGETGAKKLLLHACHNISKRDFDAGLGYVELMSRNVENLKQALH